MSTPSYSNTEIPIKFASREISATDEFRSKWSGKNAAIVISDVWHGSGVPQKRLAQLLHLLVAIPMRSDVLIMLQGSPSSVDCAKELISASEHSVVVYDSTSTFSAVYPPDSFEWEGDASDNGDSKSSRLIYAGPDELIPKNVVDAYVDSLIIRAEDGLCHLESDDDSLYWRRRVKFNPFTAKRYIDAMSCGMVKIPSRVDLGIEHSDYAEDDVLASIRSKLASLESPFGSYWFSLPVPDNVKTYMEEVAFAKRAAGAIRKIWERALECTPFVIATSREKLDEFMHNMDAQAIEYIAEATGAKQMIHAYMSGVPLEDILA